MGHSRADKAQTHEPLVEAAAARFREKGLDGISLADLMKELGLTHGGFYKHFASRDALVTEAVEYAYQDGERTVAKIVDDQGQFDLSRYVDFYLSDSHRGAARSGCAISALSADISRRGGPSFPGNKAEQRKQAIAFMTRMYGAILVARGAGDSALSKEILDTVRE